VSVRPQKLCRISQRVQRILSIRTTGHSFPLQPVFELRTAYVRRDQAIRRGQDGRRVPPTRQV
jgi:hypothetical protein